jgi:hypothetical protein
MSHYNSSQENIFTICNVREIQIMSYSPSLEGCTLFHSSQYSRWICLVSFSALDKKVRLHSLHILSKYIEYKSVRNLFFIKIPCSQGKCFLYLVLFSAFCKHPQFLLCTQWLCHELYLIMLTAIASKIL